jgi:hypothetical protein
VVEHCLLAGDLANAVVRSRAGYSWTVAELSDSDIVKMVIEPAPAHELGGKPPGTSLDELLSLEAVQVGRATIRLVLRRSWEKGGKMLDQRTLDVTVMP